MIFTRAAAILNIFLDGWIFKILIFYLILFIIVIVFRDCTGQRCTIQNSQQPWGIVEQHMKPFHVTTFGIQIQQASVWSFRQAQQLHTETTNLFSRSYILTWQIL